MFLGLLDPDPDPLVRGMDPDPAPDSDPSIIKHIQGADDKLGQFLNQDIEASASHRNVLRHFLESYTSLLSRNADKPSLIIKIWGQSTKLLQLSKNLCAPGRNQQEIARFLKVHMCLVYLLKTVLNQNQDIGEEDVKLVQN
jgi:hypothetical protein